MLRIDGQVLSCFGLGEPCQLHDRAASRVEDDPFDVPGVSLDAVAVAGQGRLSPLGGSRAAATARSSS